MDGTAIDTEGFYLGGVIDPATGDRADGIVDFDYDDLTTHGVIVGMTGSGKTGLGIIYIEEALRRGIPALVLDPKGDMTNLLLTFPELRPADFEPWVDELDARRQDKTVAELAASTAELWRGGLERWGLGGADIAALRAAADFTIYTPGSRMGVPLNLVGSLRRPHTGWDEGAEQLRDEIDSFVAGLLGLVGIEADPVSSREHILLANLIEHGWRSDVDLDMAVLLDWVQRPPVRKLGVFDVETFFPRRERTELALRLNGILASPSFTEWTLGDPVDAGALLWSRDGRPRASILYMAHLSEDERQFVAALALSRLVTWMRRQQGTGGLRALVYLDEAFGFAPPVGEPPAKRPLLTLLKQARAYGVGLVVATQNPMDLDYKAMSNAGTWNIGRLQTERDKARILEALASAGGGTDVATFDTLISGLGKRQFVLHTTGGSDPVVFGTRWAMSYLRGPLTGPQISALSGAAPPAPQQAAPPAAEPAREAALGDDETTVMPAVADGVAVRFADPAAAWGPAVGLDPTSTSHQAAIVATVALTYDEARAGVEHHEVWEAVVTPVRHPLDPATVIAVDHDPRDFHEQAPANATYRLPAAPLDSKSFFRSIEAALRDHLDRTGRVTIFRNADLGLYSRVGESRADFARRAQRAADDAADDAAAALRDKYQAKLERARDQLEAARRRTGELEVDVAGAKRTAWTDLAGTVIDFLSGRRSVRRATTTARQRGTVRSKEQRLETARRRQADRADAVEELDAELEVELDGLAGTWDDKAAAIDELEIGLERDDVTVEDLFVAWIPV